MGVLVKATISTIKGNQMAKDPNFLKNIENHFKKFSCEDSYFTEINGSRTMVFVSELPCNRYDCGGCRTFISRF